MVEPGHRSGKDPVVRVIKSRYPMFEPDEEYAMTKSLILQMKQFLEEGVSPEELLEQQRQDYIGAITAHLDTSATAKTIWPALKQNANHKDTALKDMPLPVIKKLFSQLVSE
jgi:hypothetical protein